MAFAQASSRPIRGAVATLGVSERVAFLRRTYAHLGVALLAFAGLTAYLFRYQSEFSFKMSVKMTSGMSWLLVIVAFMAVGWVAEKLAKSQASPALQYVGLGIGVLSYALLFQPLIWVVFFKFAKSTTTSPIAIVTQAVAITMVIFVGLTLTVFISKKDFSFMRGALMIDGFAALGTVVASMLFGFSLGAVFSGLMVALMAGYVLYETSAIMRDFPPTYHVAAALMLFGTVATMFWHVLRLLMSLRGND